MLKPEENPFWELEAIHALGQIEHDTCEEYLARPARYNMTKAAIEELFRPYIAYKRAVAPELLAVLERYPEMRQYFLPEQEKKYCILESATVLFFAGCRHPGSSGHLTEEEARRKETLISVVLRELMSEDGYYEEDSEKILFRDAAEVAAELDRSRLPAERKFQLLKLYLNRDRFLEDLSAMVKELCEILKKHYPVIQQSFELLRDQMDEEVIRGLLLAGGSGLQIQMLEEGECRIWAAIFYYSSISVHQFDKEWKGGQGIRFSIGMFVPKLAEGKREKEILSTEELLEICKALGDPKRLRIFQLIGEKSKTYLQELAKEIELTPATVSHHILSLLDADLIGIVVNSKGKRIVYYEVNTKKLEKVGKTFLEIAKKTAL